MIVKNTLKFISLYLVFASFYQVYGLENSSMNWVKEQVKEINSTIDAMKKNLSLINTKLGLHIDENIKTVKISKPHHIETEKKGNANVRKIETKLNNLIKNAENNKNLAHKLYDSLKELAKTLMIGDFPQRTARTMSRESFIKLLQDSKNRIISFLIKVGHEDDEKEALDALEKIKV